MMKKLIAKLVAAIMVFSVLSFTIPALADDAVTDEIAISSFQNKDSLVADKDINLEVRVTRDKIKNPAKTLKDEDNALVYVFFTKGKIQRQAQLTLSKNGLYKGKIKFPSSGKWKVNVMAMVPDAALGKYGTDTMETTWNVKEPKVSVWVWVLSAIGAILVILIIFFIVKGIRKRNARIEAEKKAKLAQKKNKKSKKRR